MDRHAPRIATALTAISLALVAFLALTTPTYTIDSYFYLVKARSLASGEGLTLTWGQGYDRLFFAGYSVWLAPFVGLFGRDGWVAGNLVAHALAAWALWRLLARAGSLDPAVRLAAHALTVLNPVWLQWHALPMAEVALSAAALWSLERVVSYRADGRARDALLAGLLAGLALLCRAEGALLGPLLLGIGWPRRRERRAWLLIAGAALLFVLPEASHRAWLRLRLPAEQGTVGYLDVADERREDVKWLEGTRGLVTAPYRPSLSGIREADLYRRFVPPWLETAQWAVMALWLAALVLALFAPREERWRTWLALGFVGYAALHATWFYRYERFVAVVVPLAALLLATAIAELGRRFDRKWVTRVVAALVVVVCAGYGLRAGQVHGARLSLHQRERDYRAAAERVVEHSGDAPSVADVGPYVAYDLKGPVLFDAWQRHFYDDTVPDGLERADFLRIHGVRAIITKNPQRWRISGADVERVRGLSVVLLPEDVAAGTAVR